MTYKAASLKNLQVLYLGKLHFLFRQRQVRNKRSSIFDQDKPGRIENIGDWYILFEIR